ncbi:MAG: LysR family transcriptional regulator [Streptosporangiales bacterium]|nr:LysR family transcriptional regulator [Streptosporangiales bacterium]
MGDSGYAALADPLRRDAADPPWTAMPAELADLLRPYLGAATEHMVGAVKEHVPEFAGPPGSLADRRVQRAVGLAARQFVEVIENPDASWDSLSEVYRAIGADEARRGRSLDGLQTAMRVSGQVACRRFTKDAYRLGWSPGTVGLLSESLFVFLERIAAAAAAGYSDARERIATEDERHRWRLRDLLVGDPPPSTEAIADRARAARWEVPATIAVVAVRGEGPRVAPPTFLADWEAEPAYCVVPDPETPAQRRQLAAALGDGLRALGPTVPPERGAVSLRWARTALELAERGVIQAGGLIRCADHVPTLAAAAAEDLIAAVLPGRLRPLLRLPEDRRRRLAETMLVYLETGSAAAAAEQVHVHPQTVRYRLRQLEELFGDEFADPRLKLEFQLLLHAWLTLGLR